MAGAGQPMEVEVIAKLDQFQKGFDAGIKQLDNFAKRAKAASPAVDGMSKGMNGLGAVFAANQNKIQNTSYQIQDFAVQLASGTSATRAMSQQLPQLLSGFGVFGALIGTAAAVLLPLAANFLTSSTNAKTLGDAMKDLKASSAEYLGALRSVKDALNDPAWANTEFGKAMVANNEILKQVALTKFKDDLKVTGQAIATEFGLIQGSFQKTNDVLAGIDAKFLKSVSGLKEVRNQFRDGSKDIKGFYVAVNSGGDAFLNMVKGLRNYGVEANKAAQLTKAFMDALQSGDPRAVASAIDALNKQIEITGKASGQTAEQIAQQQQSLAALASEMGGVISTSSNLQGAWARLGAQAVATAGQISTLVAQMSQLNLVGAARTWESVKSAYTESGAAGVVNNFTQEFTKNLQTNAKAIVAQGEAVKDGLDPLREIGRETKRLADLEKAGVITKDEYTAAVAKLNDALDGAGGKGGKGGGGGKGSGTAKKLKEAGDAAKKAGEEMKGATDGVKEFADGLKEVAQSAAQGVVDALFSIAEGSKSAKEAFTELAKSLLKQVAQMIVQLLILKPLMGMFGGGFGGLMGGGLMSMSRSGPTLLGSPRSSTIGNYSGFAPTPSVMQAVRSSSASVSAAALPAPMNVNVINNAGVNVKTQRDGRDLQIILDMAEEMVADKITRGGNRIDAAMQRAFGARRVGY